MKRLMEAVILAVARFSDHRCSVPPGELASSPVLLTQPHSEGLLSPSPSVATAMNLPLVGERRVSGHTASRPTFHQSVWP